MTNNQSIHKVIAGVLTLVFMLTLASASSLAAIDTKKPQGKPSKAANIGVGTAAGAVGGALIGGRKGAAIGAGAGAGAGYLVYRNKDKKYKESQRSARSRAPQRASGPPSKVANIGVGTAAGAVGGALIGGRKGAVIGAGAGAGTGYLVYRNKNKKFQEKQR
jgi:osmotically inducible lipoprotein OsmB